MAKMRSGQYIFEIAKELVRLGLLTPEAPNNIKRIVIDLDGETVPMIYIQYFGEDSVMKGLPSLIEGMLLWKEDDAHRGSSEVQQSDAGSAEPDTV
jgi:hypothetical protein